MTDFDRDADRVRALLTEFDPGEVPAPDITRIVELGKRGARWRIVDRTLAVAVVAALVVGAVVLFSHRVSPAPGPTDPSPSATTSAAGYALQIRPVLTEAPVGATPCPKDPAQTPAATPTTACSTDGTLVYTLGPAALAGDGIANLQADPATIGGGFEVIVELTPAGSTAFATMTGYLAQQQAPQNQLAFYAQGRVLSSPYVSTAIVGGLAQIAGFPTFAAAQDFVTAVTP
jgi:preprotein translocase subunit SecD